MALESLVTDIQHFSLHDGPGIRTTVFFKGCPLACRWCHNPEAISFTRDLMFYRQLCTDCGKCLNACDKGCFSMVEGSLVLDWKDCTFCGDCADICSPGALELKGRGMSIDGIVSECLIDKPFYKDNGGVTISGGEALRQGEFLISLLKRLKAEGLHVVLDSCGDGDPAVLQAASPYVDLYYYDLKCMTSSLHREWTGKGNELILSNLISLLESEAPIIIRTPFISGFNDKTEEMELMADFLAPFSGNILVHFLPYHSLGTSKNLALGQNPVKLSAPSHKELETLKTTLSRKGIKVKIFKH